MLMRQEPNPCCGIRLFECYVCYDVETANNEVKERFKAFLMRYVHVTGCDVYISLARSVQIAGYDVYISLVAICTHRSHDLYTSQATMCTYHWLRSVHIARTLCTHRTRNMYRAFMQTFRGYRSSPSFLAIFLGMAFLLMRMFMVL